MEAFATAAAAAVVVDVVVFQVVLPKVRSTVCSAHVVESFLWGVEQSLVWGETCAV